MMIRTEQEKKLHERAVKVRRMTDQQLCDYLDAQYQRGREDGGKDQGAAPTAVDSVSLFIGYLEGRLEEKNGIGRGTILQLRKELGTAVAAGLFRAVDRG